MIIHFRNVVGLYRKTKLAELCQQEPRKVGRLRNFARDFEVKTNQKVEKTPQTFTFFVLN